MRDEDRCPHCGTTQPEISRLRAERDRLAEDVEHHGELLLALVEACGGGGANEDGRELVKRLQARAEKAEAAADSWKMVAHGTCPPETLERLMGTPATTNATMLRRVQESVKLRDQIRALESGESEHLTFLQDENADFRLKLDAATQAKEKAEAERDALRGALEHADEMALCIESGATPGACRAATTYRAALADTGETP